MENLTKAVIKVMQTVKGIDKSMTVGTGSYSYKGVPDQEVKKVIGEAMAENGLAILPVNVQPTTRIERWEENGKIRQMIFTEVITEYLLLHVSGESVTLRGYGHGTDNQDKAAGKATTYALKYALLYSFLVPTGKIDDTDNEHSDSKPVPQKQVDLSVIMKELQACKTTDEMSKVWVKLPPAAREQLREKFSAKRAELEGA